MSQNEKFIHLAAGGIGGTVGAILTCPLEVIKTRLQASNADHERRRFLHAFAENEAVVLSSPYSGITCHPSNSLDPPNRLLRYHPFHTQQLPLIDISPANLTSERLNLTSCFRQITENEGYRALFKGLGPNLIGVAPTRAIYFCTYSWAKSTLNSISSPDTPLVHLLSASCAGFVSCSLTNPIWFVKTRIQLSRRPNVTAAECIRRVYKEKGILGFYKGITASYFGISETMIHFVIYEALKARLQRWQCCAESDENHGKPASSLLSCMAAGSVSKTIASCIAYPHEVARTRLREEHSPYTGFFQTLQAVAREEGIRGLYRGLGTQLLRQVPNTAIMMTTYETCVYVFRRWRNKHPAAPAICTVFDDEEGQFYVHNASTVLERAQQDR